MKIENIPQKIACVLQFISSILNTLTYWLYGCTMFNKLSFKIGLLFFVFILIIETFLFFVLYANLANDRVEEVMNSLLARGNTHRDVLEDHFDQPTRSEEHTSELQSRGHLVC